MSFPSSGFIIVIHPGSPIRPVPFRWAPSAPSSVAVTASVLWVTRERESFHLCLVMLTHPVNSDGPSAAGLAWAGQGSCGPRPNHRARPGTPRTPLGFIDSGRKRSPPSGPHWAAPTPASPSPRSACSMPLEINRVVAETCIARIGLHKCIRPRGHVTASRDLWRGI